MKCSYGKAVQWRDGEALNTGVLVLCDGEFVTLNGRQEVPDFDDLVQVAHSYTRELEFVEFGRLSDYPSEKIEEPGK